MTNELKREQGLMPASTGSLIPLRGRTLARVHVIYTLGVESRKTAEESASRGIPYLDEAGINTSHLPDKLVELGNATGIYNGFLETPVALGRVNDNGQMENGAAWSIIEVGATRPAVVSQQPDKGRVIMVHIFDPGNVLSEKPIQHVVERLSQGNVQGLPTLPPSRDLEEAA